MDRTERLIEESCRVIQILDDVGEKIWTEKWKRIVKMLEARRISEALEYLFVLYGGMGTMNDFVISPLNGHNVEGLKARQLNEELTLALSDIYGTATYLKRQLT